MSLVIRSERRSAKRRARACLERSRGSATASRTTILPAQTPAGPSSSFPARRFRSTYGIRRDALAANGFRVLRYDYFGRGFSDRPQLRYDLATYDRQLTELLDTLGLRGPIDVAGISMGGVVAAHFADRHPERVRSLTLVGPAFGLMPETPSPLRIRRIGDFVMTVAAPEMAKGQLQDFLHPEHYPAWVDRYEVQMQYKGFRRSMLETLRGDVFKRPVTSFTTLATSRIPMLIVWGRADRTVPFARSVAVRAEFPRAEFHAIAGAAHVPQIEQAAVVDSVVLAFLQRH